jgi:hypothetical protein
LFGEIVPQNTKFRQPPSFPELIHGDPHYNRKSFFPGFSPFTMLIAAKEFSASAPFSALHADIDHMPTTLRAAITAVWRRDEREAVQWLLGPGQAQLRGPGKDSGPGAQPRSGRT